MLELEQAVCEPVVSVRPALEVAALSLHAP
jgi:hypothetical protein